MEALFSDDARRREAALSILARHGRDAAEAVLRVVFRRPDPNAFLDGAVALIEIGRPSAGPILSDLERGDPPRRPEDIYRVETLAEVLDEFNDRRAVGTLRKWKGEFRRLEGTARDPLVRQCARAARIRLGRVLYDLGDRNQAEDLLTLLGDGRRRVHVELIDLLGKMGDGRALLPLARLYRLEERFSGAGAQLIKRGIRDIVHRSPDALEDACAEGSPRERQVLERICPARPHRRRPFAG